MEGAVANYADGVAQSLVGKLGQLLGEEYRLLSSVRGEVVHLRDDVAIMNALLRMLSEADDGAVDHFVREWMKQVRELAYDAEDCIDIFVLRITFGPRIRVGGAWWHLVVSLRARHRLAADIQALRARAAAIGERRARYGVDGQALRRSPHLASSAAATARVATSAATQDPPTQQQQGLVGIADQLDCLSDKVLSEDQDDTRLKVFSIVGFGGLGKTTLAVEVCRRLREVFTCQALVSVSQAFDASKDMRLLLQRILQQVVMLKSDGQHKGFQEEDAVPNMDGDVEDVARMLRRRLKEKRYLIVIDDVWTISAWDAIRSKLPENNNSSRIIVTTRIESVAKTCSPASAWGRFIHRLNPLDPQDSKRLFIDRVFGQGNTCPEELKDALDEILRKCGGLPLAIVSIGSLLASYNSPRSLEMWTRICNSIGSQMESNPTLEGMRQLITLSYNHLPHRLKSCMMYFSIFPEDYAVNKDRLFNRWIAEGLVPAMRGLTAHEVAESYFDELLSRNMIKPEGVTYDGEVTKCSVHDMMLEVIVSKSLEANFVTLVGGSCGETSYDAVRRLSIQGDLGSSVEEMSMRHVRSLCTFRPEGQAKLLDRLGDFTLLRVLDLPYCQDLQDHHMKHICRLFLLRFLNLNGTDITVLPSQIGEVRYLQTLWLNSTLLQRVPDSVINLEKLEDVSIEHRFDWKVFLRLPRGLKKMKALRVLITGLELREGDAEIAKEVGDLVQLQKLRINLNCENCWDKLLLEELARSIGNLCSLRAFRVEDFASHSNNMNFLLNLPSPPLLLRELRIGGTIDRLPDWVESLTHLVHIEFWWVSLHSDEIYGVLYKLPNLLKITLDRECCKDEELVARSIFKFPMLKELAIVRDDGSPKVVRFEEGAMEKLEMLTMCFYAKEKCLMGVENLTSLQEVELRGNRTNKPPLDRAVEHLKAVNQNRQESDQFKVIVKYE